MEVRHKSRGKNSSDDTLRQEMRKLVDLNTEVGRIVLISGKYILMPLFPIKYMFNVFPISSFQKNLVFQQAEYLLYMVLYGVNF